MSLLKQLRNNGWKGNSNFAISRYNTILSLQDLASRVQFEIIGSFAITFFNEHYSTNYDSPIHDEILIRTKNKISFINNIINTFHEIKFINHSSLFLDNSFYIKITENFDYTPIITIKFWTVDMFSNDYLFLENKFTKHHISDVFNYSFRKKSFIKLIYLLSSSCVVFLQLL